MANTAGLRVGQLNLQGSASATKELPVVGKQMGLDLALVQEQHRHTRIVECGSNPKAGILVLNPEIAITFLDGMSNEHCAVAHIKGAWNLDLYVISAYCQYSHDISRHLEHLTHVLDQLAGRKVLIGMDSNAHSPLWHCERRQYVGRGPDTEYRKAQMESFIFGRGLQIQNVEGQPPTFHGPNGYSNVDLTLSTRGVTVAEWRVNEGASISDHQLITFRVGTDAVRPEPRRTPTEDAPRRFRERGVDWERFQTTLQYRMGRLRVRRTAEEICTQYSEILTRTAEDCLGERKAVDTCRYEWWSPELDRLRKTVYNARRNWQRARKMKSESEPHLNDLLRSARRSYKVAMKDAEIAHFRQIADSGNEDPWGLAYRAASGRLRPPPNVMNGIKLLEGHTHTATETMTGLLKTLCPDDDPASDTAYHRQVRIAAACAPPGDDCGPPTREALERIVKNLPNTAPGMDGISARIVKHAWKVSEVEMLLMYSACIAEGVFPTTWKTGRLVVLPKGNDKPLSDPKAYRPVTLLSILGKILERLIIVCAPCLHRNLSPAQHGFTRGKSTVTALNAVLDRVANTAENYVQVVLLDISGAFDNAWWPMVLVKLKQGGCPPNIYKLIVSYFTNRRVGLFMGRQAVWKKTTMGCPQGSVLGPTLWNLLLDDILKLPVPEGVSMVAYADDITLIIEAPSRAAIEKNALSSLRAVSDWGYRNRLSFSAAKSQTLTMKGKFKRPPTIRMDGASIVQVASARLLGVAIDEASSYVTHANLAGQKAVNCFGKVSRVSASTWGIRYKALRVLYAGTYVAVITYAAAVWWRRSSHYAVQSKLLRTQRPALVLLTKAYRSVSTAALPVLAAVLPADLEVVRAGRFAQEGLGLVGRERRARKKELTELVVASWQTRWTSGEKGRDLKMFFPNVADRLAYGWVEPDYVVSQILTGHGCFNKRLHGMSLRDSAACCCGEADESRDHVLWECKLYEEERDEMLKDWSRTVAGPVYFKDLVDSEDGFTRLKVFAHRWHAKRKELEG